MAQESPSAAASTAPNFDSIASRYGAGEYHRRRHVAVMAVLRDEFSRARDVLDLGCGNGSFLTEFARLPNVGLLVGADRSPQMLGEVRRRLGDRPQLARADMSALPFAAARFDLVICSHVLVFASDLGKVVREIAHSLRPGGSLIATLSPRGGMRSDLQHLMTAEQWGRFEPLIFGEVTHMPSDDYSQSDYARAFNGAGLSAEPLRADYEIEWSHVEEFLNGQWLRRDSFDRSAAQALIDEVGAAAPRPWRLAEPMMVGRKPRA